MKSRGKERTAKRLSRAAHFAFFAHERKGCIRTIRSVGAPSTCSAHILKIASQNRRLTGRRSSCGHDPAECRCARRATCATLAYPGNILTKADGGDALEFSRSNPVEHLVLIVVCAAPAHAGAVFFMISEAVTGTKTGVPLGRAALDFSVRPLFRLLGRLSFHRSIRLPPAAIDGN